MGQIRLSRLPLTKKWRRVIRLIGNGENSAKIAAAAFDAAKSGFQRAVTDPTLNQTFRLFTQIPIAAREPDFAIALRQRGLSVSEQPSLFDLIGAFTDSIDNYVRRYAERTDIGEMAQLSAVECLTARGSYKLESLFRSTPEETAAVFKQTNVEQFGASVSDFFARFTQRYLTYYLSRELSNHVGGKRRFFNCAEHTEFIKALEVQCRLTCRSVEDLAQQWVTETEVQQGLSSDRTNQFLHLAFEKIQDELLMEAMG